ncbi:MAG: 23S rRNA (uracil(1939)-C(5))-methyltransferase RlmD [Synergistaceae bacterium]|nr:23S rRNA (uracil(1939)-C(5))-methyltransferase RlmD [Synergistaceae bacterium]
MLQGEIKKFKITEINNEGEGIVRLGNERFVVFVPDALPEEEATCRIVQAKKNYAVAKVLERHNDSSKRIKPLCPVYGKCGGCQLQHIDYSSQLELKRKTVYDAIKRIGGVPDPCVDGCIPSPSQWGYRNKASLPVQTDRMEKFIAGFYKNRSHDIVPFIGCPVLLPKLESNVVALLRDLKEAGLVGWNEHNSNVMNFIRHLVFRTAKFTDHSLCGVVAGRSANREEARKLKNIAAGLSDHLKGMVFNKNLSKGNFIWGDEFSSIHGDTVMQEMLGKYRFNFEISSFFQINSEQALALYEYAAKMAAGESPENILELYSGAGTLTAFLSEAAKHVTAVEEWPQASKYLKINAELNGLNNITGHSGSAEDVSEALSGEKFNTIVLDPPRTGCDPRVIAAIIKISPQKIVYVSCGPATLARDIKSLMSNGYAIRNIQPFDMFPQTGHVETVVLMSRKDK